MTCACESADPYRCWQIAHKTKGDARYTLAFAIEMDGGPCYCDCHECHDDGEGDVHK